MRRRTAAVAVLSTVGILSTIGAPPATAALNDPASGESHSQALSADGRWLAFISSADNLLAGDPANDTNGYDDAFLLDTQSGTIEIVSRAPGGDEADGHTTEVDVSANGRYVAFATEATNLLAVDENGPASDVYVLDRQTDTLTLASRRGAAGLRGDGESLNVSITNDGTKVAFTSSATNLVNGDTNNEDDAFVRDLVAGATTRVSTNSNAKQVGAATTQAVISGNGSTVAFQNTAAGLVNNDTNRQRDVFVKVLATDRTFRVSLTNTDGQANDESVLYDISNSGKLVVFTSDATNLVKGDTNGVVDAFVRDRTAETTVRVSRRGATQANAASYGVAISPDGAYVAFTTTATNLGGAEVDENGAASDVYEFEIETKLLRRVAVDTTGGWANGGSVDPTYGSSTVLGFTSFATDLAPSDVDVASDVYTRTFTDARDAAGTTGHWSHPAPSA